MQRGETLDRVRAGAQQGGRAGGSGIGEGLQAGAFAALRGPHHAHGHAVADAMSGAAGGVGQEAFVAACDGHESTGHRGDDGGDAPGVHVPHAIGAAGAPDGIVDQFAPVERGDAHLTGAAGEPEGGASMALS